MYLKEKIHKNAQYNSVKRELIKTRLFIKEIRLKISSELFINIIRN